MVMAGFRSVGLPHCPSLCLSVILRTDRTDHQHIRYEGQSGSVQSLAIILQTAKMISTPRRICQAAAKEAVACHPLVRVLKGLPSHPATSTQLQLNKP